MSGIPLELGPQLVKAKLKQKGKTIISLLSNASHFIEQWKVSLCILIKQCQLLTNKAMSLACFHSNAYNVPRI